MTVRECTGEWKGHFTFDFFHSISFEFLSPCMAVIVVIKENKCTFIHMLVSM